MDAKELSRLIVEHLQEYAPLEIAEIKLVNGKIIIEASDKSKFIAYLEMINKPKVVESPNIKRPAPPYKDTPYVEPDFHPSCGYIANLSYWGDQELDGDGAGRLGR